MVHYADEQDITVNVYLEDWSNGIKDSPEYVFQLMDGLKETSVKRFMLPDTLGILNPLQVIEYMRKMKKRYPNTHLDFHAHNDYDLAVSNVLAAVLSGVRSKRHIVKIADWRWHQIESSRFIISKAANLLHKYHPYFCG